MSNKIFLALPKGRILEELLPILEYAGIIPEEEFFNDNSRKLRFSTNISYLDIIRVRSFDVVTFVTYSGAALGVAGSDVLDEFDHPDIYAPVNLNIGKCRMSLAAPVSYNAEEDLKFSTHVKVATKYPKIAREYFANLGIQAECIKLNGAMELAPELHLSNYIVDLVSTGSTLKANGLVEVKKISEVASYLIVNKAALKTKADLINPIINKIKEAIYGKSS